MNLNAAIRKARKIVNERKRRSNANENKIIVTNSFTKELEGELVVVLHNPSND